MDDSYLNSSNYPSNSNAVGLNFDPTSYITDSSLKSSFIPRNTIDVSSFVSVQNGDYPYTAFKIYCKELRSLGIDQRYIVTLLWKQEPPIVKQFYINIADTANDKYEEKWPNVPRRRLPVNRQSPSTARVTHSRNNSLSYIPAIETNYQPNNVLPYNRTVNPPNICNRPDLTSSNVICNQSSLTSSNVVCNQSRLTSSNVIYNQPRLTSSNVIYNQASLTPFNLNCNQPNLTQSNINFDQSGLTPINVNCDQPNLTQPNANLNKRSRGTYTIAACDHCKKSKVKCKPSSSDLCERCGEKNVDCTFSPQKRRGPNSKSNKANCTFSPQKRGGPNSKSNKTN
ncbi:17497_t:CDS:1 [Cetraspora pellucida]|uniref:17497_t:CDS:1 n=1 Tax=Cetraspora pellucida TaxID=1433469 RepID=A0A9N9GNB5_9GLOM|nr:17497_t:CDS:1 [Cetraspora pellucida]